MQIPSNNRGNVIGKRYKINNTKALKNKVINYLGMIIKKNIKLNKLKDMGLIKCKLIRFKKKS